MSPDRYNISGLIFEFLSSRPELFSRHVPLRLLTLRRVATGTSAKDCPDVLVSMGYAPYDHVGQHAMAGVIDK